LCAGIKHKYFYSAAENGKCVIMLTADFMASHSRQWDGE